MIPRLHEQGGTPNGGQPLLVELLGLQDSGQGGDLALPIAVVEPGVGQPFTQLPEHGHDRGTVLHLLEAGKVVLLEGLVPKERD